MTFQSVLRGDALKKLYAYKGTAVMHTVLQVRQSFDRSLETACVPLYKGNSSIFSEYPLYIYACRSTLGCMLFVYFFPKCFRILLVTHNSLGSGVCRQFMRIGDLCQDVFVSCLRQF